ncbi:unnamed protein product [marine sediment metagenome]|uniref:Uncharacterized protein n=1 Tax=marine sediment metagenome TaxID=412755 RepID=X1SJK2_9ZZZZ
MMNDSQDHSKIVSYKFHHIDINKCKICKDFSCEEACFRGIYEVMKKNSEPQSIVIEDRERRNSAISARNKLQKS